MSRPNNLLCSTYPFISELRNYMRCYYASYDTLHIVGRWCSFQIHSFRLGIVIDRSVCAVYVMWRYTRSFQTHFRPNIWSISSELTNYRTSLNGFLRKFLVWHWTNFNFCWRKFFTGKLIRISVKETEFYSAHFLPRKIAMETFLDSLKVSSLMN